MRSRQSGLFPLTAANEPLQTKGARTAARELFELFTPVGSGKRLLDIQHRLFRSAYQDSSCRSSPVAGNNKCNLRLTVGFDLPRLRP
jgi:hypothetical protein